METSGFVQIFLYTWLYPIIQKGLKKTLEQEDLGECPETLKSKETLKKLKAILKNQDKKHGKNNRSLFWIYLRLVRKKLFTTFCVIATNICVEFLLAVSIFLMRK